MAICQSTGGLEPERDYRCPRKRKPDGCRRAPLDLRPIEPDAADPNVRSVKAESATALHFSNAVAETVSMAWLMAVRPAPTRLAAPRAGLPARGASAVVAEEASAVVAARAVAADDADRLTRNL
jgi:hypothetical protein